MICPVQLGRLGRVEITHTGVGSGKPDIQSQFLPWDADLGLYVPCHSLSPSMKQGRSTHLGACLSRLSEIEYS